MRLPPNNSLPREQQPPRDVFAREGAYAPGACFVRVVDAIGNLLEEMPAVERQEIYMSEIPMGYKVLFDLEAVHTSFGSGAGTDPGFRSVADFWRAPEESFLLIYDRRIEYPDAKVDRWRRAHYRLGREQAVDEGKHLSRAWGCKVAVARVICLIDWH